MRPVRTITSILCSSVALALVLTVGGCSEPTAPASRDTSPSLSKKGGGGSGGGGDDGAGSSGGEVIVGDFALAAADAPALTTSCPSQPLGANSWVLVFGKSGCLIVAPEPWTGVLYPEAYPLLDDLLINTMIEKGKTGRITHVRVAGQDVDGPEGIWHHTDWIPVEQPVVPSKAGFTLHVHARNVPVWRTDSHLAGGQRVEIIGYISIGDVVYPAQ